MPFNKPTGGATPPRLIGRIATLLAACMSLACLWTVPAGAAVRAASTAAPELQLLGQGPVSVSAVQGKDTAEAYVTVLNAGSTTASISASFQAASAALIKASLGAPTSLGPGEADRVKLIFTGLKALSEPVSGQIVIRGGAAPVAQSATVSPALQPSADWPLLIVVIGFGSAALFFGGLATAVTSKKGLSWLGNPAPSPKWSFESWATHLTAVGALLGTVLGTASLPETPTQIDKTSLVALSLFFGALVVVAPFVFEAIQRPTPATSAESEGGTGFVGVLLLSCAITFGAVIGEIVTLGLASWEITGGGAGGVLIEIGLGVLFVLAVYYVTVTACNAAMTDWQTQAKASAPAPVAGAPALAATLTSRALGVVGEEALDVTLVRPATQPRSSWSLP